MAGPTVASDRRARRHCLPAAAQAGSGPGASDRPAGVAAAASGLGLTTGLDAGVLSADSGSESEPDSVRLGPATPSPSRQPLRRVTGSGGRAAHAGHGTPG